MRPPPTASAEIGAAGKPDGGVCPATGGHPAPRQERSLYQPLARTDDSRYERHPNQHLRPVSFAVRRDVARNVSQRVKPSKRSYRPHSDDTVGVAGIC
jgi:hypothetical protein